MKPRSFPLRALSASRRTWFLRVLAGSMILLLYRTFQDDTDSLRVSTATDTSSRDSHQTPQLERYFGVKSTCSDMATLSHCNLSVVIENIDQYELFRTNVLRQISYNNPCCDGVATTAQLMGVAENDLMEELNLQILELFSRAVDACDFSRYNYPVVDDDVRRMETKVVSIPRSKEDAEARLVFIISAFEDFDQLRELIKAIHLEQHLILFHLEANTNPTFAFQVRGLMKEYSNLHVIQFGTVVYPSDSLSQINFAILQWIHRVGFQYDYVVTLSAAAYPLYSAKELAIHLNRSPKRIRLGLLHGGDIRLCRRRATSFGLFYTRRGHKRRVANINDVYNMLENMTIPIQAFSLKGLKRTCLRKTTSGNTAVYDFDALQLLVNSTTVKDYFARFKQSGQCCVEESSWGAAMHIVGRQDEVPLPGAMWQAWPCGMGMGNVYLVSPFEEANPCLRMDDKSVYPDGPVELRNQDAIEQALIEGKRRGHLFARKFHSRDRYWMEWIQSNLHNDVGA